MSLTGNLEVFPLEEVLRLLARSRKTGCLRVDGTGHQGRVFLQNGSLTLAMTGSDEDLQRQLLASGLVEVADLRQVETGSATLADVAAPGITEFVREYTVESLYRIRRPGSGAFDFVVDLQPRYPTGQIFDVEVGIAEADRRANEWAEIESVVPDLDTPYRMVAEIPEAEEVTLAAPAWKILAALAGGAPVRRLAEYLGATEFKAAKDLAELARRRLVEAVDTATPSTAPETAVEPIGTAPDSSHDESWFQVAEPAPAAVDTEESSATEGWWQEQETAEEQPEETVAASESTGSDSDRFLESVFSQLDADDDSESDDDEADTGFNMGLLRRRRMGAAIRDSEES